MHLNDIAKFLRTAGDESRLKILCVIFEGKGACVTDMAEKLGMSVAIVSHHLRVMSKEGLVLPVRDGKRVCYRLASGQILKDLKRLVCRHK